MNDKSILKWLKRRGYEEDFPEPQHCPLHVPTSSLVGSPERVAVYARRIELGLPLWHPLDMREQVNDVSPNTTIEKDAGIRVLPVPRYRKPLKQT